MFQFIGPPGTHINVICSTEVFVDEVIHPAAITDFLPQRVGNFCDGDFSSSGSSTNEYSLKRRHASGSIEAVLAHRVE